MKRVILFSLVLLPFIAACFPERQKLTSLPKPLGSVAALPPVTTTIPVNWPQIAEDGQWPNFGGNPRRNQGHNISFPSLKFKQIWSYSLGSHTYEYRSGTNLWSESAVSFSNRGKTYLAFGAYDRKVHCLLASTGQRVWRFTTGDEVVAAPAYAKNVIVVASSDRSIYGLDLSGERKWVIETMSWSQTTAPSVMSSPLIVSLEEGRYAALGYYLNDFGRSARRQDGIVALINVETGQKRWSHTLRHDLIFGPAAGQVLGRPILFYATGDGLVCALDARQGLLAWQTVLDDRIRGCPTLATIGDKAVVLVTTRWGMLWAIDGESGQKLWSYRAGHMADGSAAVSDQIVLFGTYDRCLHAVSLRNGKGIWKFTTQGVVVSSPAVAFINKRPVAFFSSLDDYIYCLDVSTGEKLWSHKTGKLPWPYFKRGDAVFGSPLLCQSEIGPLLIHPAHDGKIYAFKANE